MRLEVVRANPAGNITLFVLTPVEAGLRAPLAERLMKMPEFGAEQVGYRLPPGEGFDGRMVMSGGEFCGNASRAYGMLVAAEKGITGTGRLLLQVSGADRPVTVKVDCEAGMASSSMPLPQKVEQVSVAGVPGILVHLGGIVHLVVEEVTPELSFFEEAEKEIFQKLEKQPDAYGVMFCERESGKLTPLVKVPSANSLFWEGSCGSGSLSVVIAQTEGMPDGEYERNLIQPAGCVRAKVRRENGQVRVASIGGTVELDPPVMVEVDPC